MREEWAIERWEKRELEGNIEGQKLHLEYP